MKTHILLMLICFVFMSSAYGKEVLEEYIPYIPPALSAEEELNIRENIFPNEHLVDIGSCVYQGNNS